MYVCVYVHIHCNVISTYKNLLMAGKSQSTHLALMFAALKASMSSTDLREKVPSDSPPNTNVEPTKKRWFVNMSPFPRE